jgi:hypothetical protein
MIEKDKASAVANCLLRKHIGSHAPSSHGLPWNYSEPLCFVSKGRTLFSMAELCMKNTMTPLESFKHGPGQHEDRFITETNISRCPTILAE